MEHLEILAPAGSPEALFPAVRLGADAVYLAGKSFGARANARNFDREELRKAVRYCHARDVKVYLAVNTLLRDEELEGVLSFAEYACSLPVDACIVQDAGIAALLRERAPGMRLHGSTQMSIHTPAGARALYEMGFSRVVLARELSAREIAEIAAASPIELEVFVHGALCMSVSGQCYFSAVLGGRSGNRGLCAQPCRLPFAADGGTGRDLSLKDLSLTPRLQELKALGVTSAKIEGRMKRPEYVAAAVSACRHAADGEELPAGLADKLGAVFSRSGFTDGYFTGKRGRSMFGSRSREDVVSATGEVLSSLRAMYQDESGKIPVDFSLRVQPGKPSALTVRDAAGHSASCEGVRPEPALRQELTAERCERQLQKTGGTPFRFSSLSADIAPGQALAAASLNELRREALAALEEKRTFREPVAFAQKPFRLPVEGRERKKTRLRARFARAEVPACFSDCELVYVPLSTPPERLEALLCSGIPAAVEVPRGLFGREEEARALLLRAKKCGVAHALAHNIGAVSLCLSLGFATHGGFGLNLTNTAALEWARAFGLADVELSFELTLAQAGKIGGSLPRGLLAYGRLPLMLCRNCPAANGPSGCRNCSTPPELTDRRGVRFPLQCAAGCTEVLNSVPLTMADRMDGFSTMNFAVLRFTVENSVESEEIYRIFHRGEKPTGGYTRGLYDRGVE